MNTMREITLDTSTGILEAVESHLFWHTDYEGIQIALKSKGIGSQLEHYSSRTKSFSITTNVYIHYLIPYENSSKNMSVAFVKGEDGHRFVTLTDIDNSGCRYLFNEESIVQSIILNSIQLN